MVAIRIPYLGKNGEKQDIQLALLSITNIGQKAGHPRQLIHCNGHKSSVHFMATSCMRNIRKVCIHSKAITDGVI